MDKHQTTIPLLTEGNVEKLRERGLPECSTDEEIALMMGTSVGKLCFLAFKHPTTTHYFRFQILKKTGKERTISAPMPNLKAAQRWILKNILDKLEVHDAAHGFRQHRSIVTNVKLHVGADAIVKIDLKNFFQSISYKRVKQLFRGFGYSENATQIFGLICTAAETEEIEIDGKIEFRAIGNRHLPQGSPASPAVSNLVCYHLDSHLARMAKNLGFCYTRYADDLTFSGSGDALRRIFNSLDDSKLIITSEGFTVNPSKTKILSKAVQQEITGIVVNKQLNISKKILKAFRATLYQIEQEGLSNKKWGNSKNLIAAITGFANYVAMVNPSKGAEFLASVKQIKQKYDNKSNIKYNK